MQARSARREEKSSSNHKSSRRHKKNANSKDMDAIKEETERDSKTYDFDVNEIKNRYETDNWSQENSNSGDRKTKDSFELDSNDSWWDLTFPSEEQDETDT